MYFLRKFVNQIDITLTENNTNLRNIDNIEIYFPQWFHYFINIDQIHRTDDNSYTLCHFIRCNKICLIQADQYIKNENSRYHTTVLD